ncbi:hypothetical protein TNCV_4428241 [Trichonephila clavipes]|nr:hypothetical protein TNCV_4428241 [Trichonephila clavipes]
MVTHGRRLSRKLSIVCVIPGGMAVTTLVIASFSACRVVGRCAFAYTCAFKCPQRKKSQRNKSGYSPWGPGDVTSQRKKTFSKPLSQSAQRTP